MTAGEPQTSFRPRSAYLGHLVVGSGDGAVLIEPSVAGELRMAAALAGPRPAAGLLYGYAHHDEEGGYTLVDGFVPAESPDLMPTDADPAVALGRLRAEAARSYPSASEVGWWRSAPRPGEEGRPGGEEGWPDPGAWPLTERPEGIGLVVFADGTPPAAASPAPHSVVQGTVLDDQPPPAAPSPSTPPPGSPSPAWGASQPDPSRSASVVPTRSRPTRGRTGAPVQSPQLVNSSELRQRRREEPSERGRGLELEAQQWVLLAMVVLVLVIVISVVVLVSRAFH